jgi:hypothetical protein
VAEPSLGCSAWPAGRRPRIHRGATLTRDYPVFVDNETEAYGLVKAFFDDYGGTYARFVEWFRTRFVPELERRNGWYWPPPMQAKLDEFRAECADKVGRSNRINEVVDLLLAEGGGEFLQQLKRVPAPSAVSPRLPRRRARYGAPEGDLVHRSRQKIHPSLPRTPRFLGSSHTRAPIG